MSNLCKVKHEKLSGIEELTLNEPTLSKSFKLDSLG